MGKWIYIFFFSGLFSVLELFLRNWGILFPAGAFFVFYTAVTFGNTAGFFCAVADAFGEFRLDKHMDIFRVRIKREFSLVDILQNPFQAVDNFIHFFLR